MSLPISIFDLFSHAIPGFFYMAFVYELLLLFRLPNPPINWNNNWSIYILVVVCSYVVGHIMETVAFNWYFLFYRRTVQKNAIKELKERYPKLKIDFEVDDRKILFSFVKKNNLELTNFIEKFKAISIMLHNISFALLLFALFTIISMIVQKEFLLHGIGIIVLLSLSFLALRRSAAYNRWYFDQIFEQALHYGRNIQEIFRKEWSEKAGNANRQIN